MRKKPGLSSSNFRTEELPSPFCKVQRFRLSITDSEGGHSTWTSKDDYCTLGSSRENHVVLFDPAVSKIHCELRMTPEGAMVRDLESRNGTLVNGVRVFDALIPVGARIQVGRSHVRFNLAAGANNVPLSSRTEFGGMVGTSEPMRMVFAVLERAATTLATVLLEGETGTGKGETAAAIHQMSNRSSAPLVVVDCGALQPSLIESELFGHERGAFTGAELRRIGAIEAANTGTLFLDEIGELPLEFQAKLLRVLENRQIRRVGSNKTVPVDIRVIAATHHDLRGDVNSGRFREDLYFRLAVLKVHLPTLRERREDIAKISERLLGKMGVTKTEIRSFLSTQLIHELERGQWRGNVRELRNYLERRWLFRDVPFVEQESNKLSSHDSRRYDHAKKHAVREFERRYVTALMQDCSGEVGRAMEVSGLSRSYLYALLDLHDIAHGKTRKTAG